MLKPGKSPAGQSFVFRKGALVAGGIYLDNATTSWPKPPGVLEAMKEFLESAGGGPGRAGHHRSIATSRGVGLAR